MDGKPLQCGFMKNGRFQKWQSLAVELMVLALDGTAATTAFIVLMFLFEDDLCSLCGCHVQSIMTTRHPN